MDEPAFVLRTTQLRAARGVTVARDVAVTAAPGDVVAVEGPNGSGKSTLLAAAAGLLPAANATVRPAAVGFSPERASVLPRVNVLRWLTGLARTAGLSRRDSADRAADVLRRLGLESAAGRSLHVLSRGNAQRALVAQALVGEPDLVILDEPSGGLDADGVARVTAEISRAAARRAVVLVARHPTAPLPLPSGATWRFVDGTVRRVERDADVARTVEVETGDGVLRQVTEAELPAVLRAALDAGVPIRRVHSAVSPAASSDWAASGASGLDAVPRRAGALARIGHGAAHRAKLLGVSQWFAAPMLVFLAVLAVLYSTDAGPPLQPAAITAIALIAVMSWLAVQAHRVEGRELSRAFAAHAGGRARAHAATDLCLVPYALVLTAAAIIWPLADQGEHPHPGGLVLRMVALHLAAALFGAGLGSVLALIERIGWRLIVAVAVFLALVTARATPLTPLLRLSTAAAPIGAPVAWLCLPGVLLAAAAAFVATKLS